MNHEPLNNFQRHYRQVVVRHSTVTVFLYCITQVFNDLFSTIKVILLEYLKQAFVTKLLLLAIFGFVQSVALDQQRTSLDTIYLFTYKV